MHRHMIVALAALWFAGAETAVALPMEEWDRESYEESTLAAESQTGSGAADSESSGEADDEESGWSWKDGLVGHSIEGDVFAEDGGDYPGWVCPDCRDPDEHPFDYVAVAYNGFWGSNPWMRTSQLGVPFRIYNLELDWVVVWFEQVFSPNFTLLPDTMQVRLRLRTGEILTFTVLQGGPDLPEADSGPTAPTSGGSSGGESDEDVPDQDDAATDWEPPDYVGTVEIVDPDEDGEFPEWELEE